MQQQRTRRILSSANPFYFWALQIQTPALIHSVQRISKGKDFFDILDFKNSNIFKNPQEIIKNQKENYLLQLSKLEILNPLNTLKRGYTLAKSDGKVISSAKQLKSGDDLEVEFEDGNVNTKVI